MKILDEIYKQLEKEEKQKTHFYVTDLGTCPRKVIMNFGNFDKKPLTNGEKLMFKKAETDHKELIKLLNDSENLFVIKGEFNISNGLPELWRGRLDCLIYDNQDKCIFPVDWKGTRSLKYSTDLPKQSHVLQIRAYIMALQNMGFPTDYGEIVYTDRTGSYQGLEFVIKPDSGQVLGEMKIYEDYYKKSAQEIEVRSFFTGAIENYQYEINSKSILPPILEREIIKSRDEFYLKSSWQCEYCYYEGLSCKPNMSKNKIAEIKDDKLKIRKGYEKFENKLNELINPKDDDFYNFCQKESKK